MYLNHNQITELVSAGGMANVDTGCINAASLDLRLAGTILVERSPGYTVDYGKRQRLDMVEVRIPDKGYVIEPGEFLLAATVELCNLPDDVAALFRIKSSMGRIGLEHMDAGWVDPGFHGALTLELCNMTRHHGIKVRAGDRIGQLVFMRGSMVEPEQSYRARGNYNGQAGVAQVGFKTP